MENSRIEEIVEMFVVTFKKENSEAYVYTARGDGTFEKVTLHDRGDSTTATSISETDYLKETRNAMNDPDKRIHYHINS